MAQMAFRIGAVGIPVVGFGYGHTIIGIKRSNAKVFAVSTSGDTNFCIDLKTQEPFTIDDDPILDRLFDERVYFSLIGSGYGNDQASFEFKIYNKAGDCIYEIDKSVAVQGLSLGGWTISSEPMEMIYPSWARLRDEPGVGEQIAVSLGLVPMDYGRLSREPDYHGIWQVAADHKQYFYRFNHIGKSVQWFNSLDDAKRRYWCFENGFGNWEVNRNSRLEITWKSGSTEVWPVPLLSEVRGRWNTTDGDEYPIYAKRVI